MLCNGRYEAKPGRKVIRLKSDINQFAELQQALLESAWKRVRPSGRLLYITCSLLPAENEDIVSNFLAVTADAKTIPLSESFGIAKASVDRPCHQPVAATAFTTACSKKSPDLEFAGNRSTIRE